jgi:pSer/pThr/pTyr-binding forkhead associated (FHA) protein
MRQDDEKDRTRIFSLPREVARLIVETGPDRGQEFLIDKANVTIGRHVKNDVCLQDEKISRFHGRVSFDKDGDFVYEDLNSTNGTTINNRWFKNEKVKINHGDKILIGGGVRLRFFTKKQGLKDWLLG